VIDVGIKVAVVSRAEEQLRVVVQVDEAHVVDGANLVGVVEAAISQFQQGAEPRGASRSERGEQGQFRDLALTESGATGAFHPRPRGRPERGQVFDRILQRLSRVLRSFGKELPQLLDPLLNSLVLAWLGRCLSSHGAVSLRACMQFADYECEPRSA